MSKWSALLLAGVIAAVAATAGVSVGRRTSVAAFTPPAVSGIPVYVAGSTSEVCRLTGAGAAGHDGVLRTARKYGLVSADHGYSFRDGGRLVFLFGDAQPTLTFPVASTTSNTDRWAHDGDDSDPRSYVNDAIGSASPRRPRSGCPRLTFARQTAATGGAHRAYVNPHVIISEPGGPGNEVSLRGNESPVSGITEHGVTYVVFKTNNPNQCPKPPPSHLPADGCLAPKPVGSDYSSVMARLVTGRGVVPDTFRYLYTLSGPRAVPAPQVLSLIGCPQPGRFVNVALANGPGHSLYMWGTSGGLPPDAYGDGCSTPEYNDHSHAYLARIPQSQIGASGQDGGNAPPAAIQYLSGTGTDGRPEWSGRESAATPLFSDGMPCAAELGVQFNSGLHRWMMLYNCKDNRPGHPNGIWMRTAPEPWGPWTSQPQTILNPDPSTHLGFCWLIHQSKGCPPSDPNPGGSEQGTYYGPYLVPGWTTRQDTEVGSTQTGIEHYVESTFYYTLDTFDPYGQWIMKSTVRQLIGYTRPAPPGCAGTTCT